MSGLPSSIIFPPSSRPVDVPINSKYYGYGSSNQVYSNAPAATNLGSEALTFQEPYLQADLYVPDATTDVTALQAAVTVLQGQVTALTLSVQTNTTDITTINSQITTINSQITTINSNVATNTANISTNTAAITAINLQIVSINSQITSINTQLGSINAQLATLAGLIIPVSFTAFGAAPNSSGASVSSNVITLQPASALSPGGVTTGTQTFAGNKTFTGSVFANYVQSTTQVAGTSLVLPSTTSGVAGTIILGAGAFLHRYNSDTNVFLGTNAGNFTLTGTSNVMVGNNCGGVLTSGATNTCVGAASGASLLANSDNTFIGYNAGSGCNTGIQNICVGVSAGSNITSGSNNIVIGKQLLLTGATSSNVIQIGDSTNTSCFLGGVYGQSAGTTPQMVTCGSDNKFSTQAIPVSGVTTLSAIGAAPNANAATITGSTLNLQPASASFGGVVTTGTQTMAGVKTFSSIMNATGGLQFSNTLSAIPTNVLSWYESTTGVYTPTLNGGATITTLTVRGSVSTTITLTLLRIGALVMVMIPAWKVTAQTGNNSSFFVTGASVLPAQFRPTYQTAFDVICTNLGTQENCLVLVSAGGLIECQRETGGNFSPAYGPNSDTCLSWVIN